MKRKLLLAAATAALFTACKGGGGAYQSAKPKTVVDSVSYAIGVQIAANLQQETLYKDIDPALIARGFYDVMNNKTKLLEADAANEVIINYMLGETKKREAAFLEKNAKEAKVKTTPSGLQYEIVSEGTGAKPTATSTVKVHYKGQLLSGNVFDSSEGGEPATFPLANLIEGWKEGILLMPVGSKFKFYVPSKLAYGERGIPQAGIGPNEPLIFDVELISIEK
jgi:FKBP-type peptidyl-prolyl cis-trans isomerase